MITGLYAGLLGMVLLFLSFKTILYRRKHRVTLGDGGIPDLQGAIRAHGNFTEYVPFCLILLGVAEWLTFYSWALHAFGILLVTGRIFHAYGLITDRLNWRIRGMMLTFTCLGLGSLTLFGLSATLLVSFS